VIQKKKIHVILCLLLFTTVSYGQNRNEKYNKYFSKDQLSFSLNSTQWLQKEKVATPSVFSRGVTIQMMYPIIGNKSNFAIAAGFGLACQNYYLKEFIHTNSDSLWFVPIPDTINYKKYKLNTNYLTIPIEFRIRTNPNKENRTSFKIYPGFRAGVLVNVHTKYIGRDLANNEKTKVKLFNIKHVAKFDYGLTLRIGYGKILFHSYYSLTQLIEPNKGPVITPVEFGITVILF